MMEIEELIKEMKELKLANPTLELQDILRLFNIHALKELTSQIARLVSK